MTCGDCRWRRGLDGETRLRLSQENKEILNMLIRQGYSTGEFVYCERLGYIESVIASRDCEEWQSGEPEAPDLGQPEG